MQIHVKWQRRHFQGKLLLNAQVSNLNININLRLQLSLVGKAKYVYNLYWSFEADLTFKEWKYMMTEPPMLCRETGEG